MPSDRRGGDAYRRRLHEHARDELRPGEQVVAMLPFAMAAKLPKRPGGRKAKVRFGIRQSWRRYRPMVVTDHRLLVFDSGRTPNARQLLGEFPLDEVTMSAPAPARLGALTFTLDLPGAGVVPFETGRRERHDVVTLQSVLTGNGSVAGRP